MIYGNPVVSSFCVDRYERDPLSTVGAVRIKVSKGGGGRGGASGAPAPSSPSPSRATEREMRFDSPRANRQFAIAATSNGIGRPIFDIESTSPAGLHERTRGAQSTRPKRDFKRVWGSSDGITVNGRLIQNGRPAESPRKSARSAAERDAIIRRAAAVQRVEEQRPLSARPYHSATQSGSLHKGFTRWDMAVPKPRRQLPVARPWSCHMEAEGPMGVLGRTVTPLPDEPGFHGEGGAALEGEYAACTPVAEVEDAAAPHPRSQTATEDPAEPSPPSSSRRHQQHVVVVSPLRLNNAQAGQVRRATSPMRSATPAYAVLDEDNREAEAALPTSPPAAAVARQDPSEEGGPAAEREGGDRAASTVPPPRPQSAPYTTGTRASAYARPPSPRFSVTTPTFEPPPPSPNDPPPSESPRGMFGRATSLVQPRGSVLKHQTVSYAPGKGPVTPPPVPDHPADEWREPPRTPRPTSAKVRRPASAPSKRQASPAKTPRQNENAPDSQKATSTTPRSDTPRVPAPPPPRPTTAQARLGSSSAQPSTSIGGKKRPTSPRSTSAVPIDSNVWKYIVKQASAGRSRQQSTRKFQRAYAM